MRKNKFSIGWLIGVHVSSTVNEVIKTILSQFFFLRKNFKRTKTQIKSKPTNKTKLSKQKTTKATSFCAQKLLTGGKLVILHFLKKIEIVLMTSFTIILVVDFLNVGKELT